ncbi:uncharacterized protein LOC134247470 [Saccostrea cucullata]|uniref:uncharacterized protein LOC134247470 n=1 Tax=Saccostrea cuccullata TaxID=36930 RepID=UPI002ED67D76
MLIGQGIQTHNTTTDIGYGSLYKVHKLGSILKSVTTKSGNIPSDIAVTKNGDLVYTDTGDKTVNIVKNEKIEEVIRLQNWKPNGVCSTPLVTSWLSCKVVNKQTIVVRYSVSNEKQPIHGARAAVVVNQAGKLRFRYTGFTPAPMNEPFSPRGITRDSQSHIVLANNKNDSIDIIDQNGHFLRYIRCGLSYSRGLCIDINDNLFVAQWEKHTSEENQTSTLMLLFLISYV